MTAAAAPEPAAQLAEPAEPGRRQLSVSDWCVIVLTASWVTFAAWSMLQPWRDRRRMAALFSELQSRAERAEPYPGAPPVISGEGLVMGEGGPPDG